jgi:hypothetical protein
MPGEGDMGICTALSGSEQGQLVSSLPEANSN